MSFREMESCDMDSLVEAQHDGRLGAREQASLARHVVTCAACRDHAAELRRMRELSKEEARPLEPLVHHRGRARLLREAAGVPRAPRRLPVGLAASFAAAVLASVALAFAATRPAPPPRVSARVATTVAALDLTVVRGDEGTSFSRQRTNGFDLVRLAQGAIHVRVHHLHPGERFVVHLDDAEVEVRGTRFDVEADGGHLTRVKVSEGVVELRRGNETRLLPAGTEWNAPVAAVVPQNASSPSVGSSPSVAGSPGSASTARKPLPSAPSPNGAGSDGSDDAAFRAGMARLEKGDFGQAASELHSFASAHPDDPRAEDAEFLEALSLSKAGRADDAARAARRYLDAHPDGYRRAEAEKLLAK